MIKFFLLNYVSDFGLDLVMYMLKIAICEDEIPQKNYLCQVVEAYFKKNAIEYKIYAYDNGKDLLLEKIFFNFIFLDIDMPELNGIDLAKKIRCRNKKAKIIYVTGYSQYLHHAFGVHAFSYLIKPVSEEEVHKRIAEAMEYFKAEAEKPVFSLKTTEGVVRIRPEKIYYFEFFMRKIRIVTSEGEYKMDGTMYQLLEQLKDHGFASPHKSFIVNLYHVKKIIGYEVYLSNHTIIPLAQKKSVIFKEQYNDFLQKSLGWI